MKSLIRFSLSTFVMIRAERSMELEMMKMMKDSSR